MFCCCHLPSTHLVNTAFLPPCDWTHSTLRVLCWALQPHLPLLRSHKLSIWPPCCTGLTGGMLDDSSDSSIQMNVSFLFFPIQLLMSLIVGVNGCHHLVWRFCSESTNLSHICCCALACGPSMAALQAFHRTKSLCPSDELKPGSYTWVIGSLEVEPSVICLGCFVV